MDSVFGLLEQNDGADEENADEEEASENDLETFPNADENADNLNNSNSPYSADEEFGKGGDGEGIYEEENNLG